MINELFPFQKAAVSDLRTKTAMALNNCCYFVEFH